MYRSRRLRKRRQRGTALIEFALLLPLLLTFVVGTVYFGYVYVLQSAASHAAQQAASAAVAVDPVAFGSESGYGTAVDRAVAQTVFRSLDWLPRSVGEDAGGDSFLCDGSSQGAVSCASSLEDSRLRVTVTLNVAGGSSPLLPQLTLPSIGSVPPASLNQLTGVAEVTL